LLPVGDARAEILPFGQIIFVPPLPSVETGAAPNATSIRGFVERENFTLPVDLEVDFMEPGLYDSEDSLPSVRPIIRAGTVVNSIFLHADSLASNRPGVKGTVYTSSVVFDTDILGVIIRRSTFDLLGNGTDAPIGAEGTVYPFGASSFRGIEFGDNKENVFLIDKRTLQVRFNTVEAIDQVRVITAPRSDGGPGVPLNCGTDVDLGGFITCFYQVILSRSPGPAEIDGWKGFLGLNPNTFGARALVHGFFDSAEQLGRPVTARSQIEALYRAVLGREPDESGRLSWENALVQRYNTILPGFVTSPEFQGLLGSTDAATIITRFYQQVLLRDPDPDGLTAWLNYLAATGNYVGLAMGFLNSPEYLSTPRTLADHVTILYRTFLGRDPEQAGLDGWVGFLAGHYGVIQDSFIASPEFQGRFFRALALP
jgi:hypothetical protein